MLAAHVACDRLQSSRRRAPHVELARHDLVLAGDHARDSRGGAGSIRRTREELVHAPLHLGVLVAQGRASRIVVAIAS